ncbi:MAG: methyltransferase domain-containing protein [Candidatus Kaiserbacteria bacterium]|nr:methyltransferase domain-containing protein [Candidatus Kaiserbacteria bacterium]MCB9816868.1 methyltransferase domain-containing protein [Candidatus Nomurabacteria bacterium]
MKTNLAFQETDWSVYATCYDTLQQLIPYQALLRQINDTLTTKPAAHLLDVGCGTGNLLQLIATEHPELDLSGVDFSPAMLKRAQNKVRALLREHDVNQGLPWPDESFEIVTSIHSLYALKDPAATLREIHRVLRKDGELIVVTPKQGYDNGLILKTHAGDHGPEEAWLHAHRSPEREMELLTRAIDDAQVVAQMRYVAEHNRLIASTLQFHFFSTEQLEQLLTSVGFTIVSRSLTYADQSHFIHAKKVTK